MNNNKKGRKDQKGLIVWLSFESQLSPADTEKEKLKLENLGFENFIVLNTDTTIIACSSDGQAFSKHVLRGIGVHWKRLMETHNQLNSIARKVDKKQLQEWE